MKSFMGKKAYLVSALIMSVFISSMSAYGSSDHQQMGGRQAAVNLGVAGDFVILAQSAITDVSTSAITGDIGLSPAAGSYFTATDGVLCDEVVGLIYTVAAGGPACETIDATKLGKAVLDFGTAYTDAAGRAYKADANHLNLGAGELGGLTLAPGVYHWDNNVTISTDVTLKGGKNDVWIFQIPGTLNISSATSVILKGVLAKNIFWVVGGAVTLGTTSHFEGNILGWTGITLNTGSSINGRLLAGTQVALQTATVTQVAQTKKACEGIMNAEKTVFDAGQKADLLAFTVAQATAKQVFDAGQKAAKLAFQLTHPTDAQLKAFTVAQEAAKRVFTATQAAAKLVFDTDQKADKLAFTLQQTIDKAQCNTLL